jgi:hypothetical protein
MQFRRVSTISSDKTDWTPTFGVAIAALTIYMVYTSLRLDKLIRQAEYDKGVQLEHDSNAADDRREIREKSDKRDKQITWAISILAILFAVKWSNLIHIH